MGGEIRTVSTKKSIDFHVRAENTLIDFIISTILHELPPARSQYMHFFTLRIQSMQQALSGHHGHSPWSASVALFNLPSRINAFHTHLSANMWRMMPVSHKYNYYTTCRINFCSEPTRTPNSVLFIPTVRSMFNVSIRLQFGTLTFWAHYIIDPTCILLPPRTATTPEPSLLKKVIAALATRYDTSATRMQCICSAECVRTWGKVRWLDGGDTMHAASVIKPAQDSRDVTFVWVYCFLLFLCNKLMHGGTVWDFSGQVCAPEEMAARIWNEDVLWSASAHLCCLTTLRCQPPYHRTNCPYPRFNQDLQGGAFQCSPRYSLLLEARRVGHSWHNVHTVHCWLYLMY